MPQTLAPVLPLPAPAALLPGTPHEFLRAYAGLSPDDLDALLAEETAR